MNRLLISISRSAAAVVAALVLATTAFAQGPQLKLDSLAGLENRASEVVDVSLDEALIQMAANVIGKQTKIDGHDARKLKEFISGLRGVYVRSYQFEQEGAYNQADVDAIRSQLRSPEWSRIAGVRSKKKNENAEVYVLTQAGKMQGLAIVAANPKELTVVNIVGTFDPSILSDLDGDFNIPGIVLERDGSEKPGN